MVGGSMTLYDLNPALNSDSLEDFAERRDPAEALPSAKLLIQGPWPEYQRTSKGIDT